MQHSECNQLKGSDRGISATCDFSTLRRAFLWENGSMVDLNALIPPGSGMQLTLAETINDRGEIAINGTPIGCGIVEACGHAVLLIPVCADGTEGCADAPLDPAVVAQSRAASGSAPKTMTAEELAIVKGRAAGLAGRYRGFIPVPGARQQ
jgi:probable HAF family extracellular repeat protein